jgi:sulfatase maturation enzyme AslB (radical SAM superfamily)
LATLFQDSILNKLINQKFIAKDVEIAWGGGEPVLLENFDKIFTTVTEKIKPFGNMVYSNAIKYNDNIEKFLCEDKAKLTTSIDAGNLKTFKKIRGVMAFEKVLKNLSN